jgi:hypothetical protein
MYTRYTITHPALTPEYFFRHRSPSSSHVKALAVAVDSDPTVLTGDPQQLIADMFHGITPRCIVFRHGFHMYLSPLQGTMILSRENVLATMLLRHHTLCDSGEHIYNSVYGDVILFGSYNIGTRVFDNRDHSVPYELIEQIIHLCEAF